jgi:hypothetical protein
VRQERRIIFILAALFPWEDMQRRSVDYCIILKGKSHSTGRFKPKLSVKKSTNRNKNYINTRCAKHRKPSIGNCHLHTQKSKSSLTRSIMSKIIRANSSKLYNLVALAKSNSETCNADAMRLSQYLAFMIAQCTPMSDSKDCTFKAFEKAGEATKRQHFV